MLHVRRELAVSERRACRVVGQPRSTQRHPTKRPAADRALVARLLHIARDYPRYGYRRAWAVLRGEGWAVNRKRIHRLWRQAGLQVPQKARKRRRVAGGATGENSTVRLAPQHPNHVWSYDFVFDATEDGRALKLLTVLDEYTRECLALVVGRSLTSRHVVATLAQLIGKRGAPGVVRSDNGGEFIAHRVAAYLHASKSDAKHIDPGAPWQNGYAESFNPPASAGRGSSATSCWARSSSARSPRRPCSSSSGAVTTTSRGRTARSATFHRPRSRPPSSPNRRRHCHSRWYEERGPVKRLRAAESERASLRAEASDLAVHASYGLSLLSNLARCYAEASLEGKRDLVGLLFPGRLVYRDGRVETPEVHPVIGLFEGRKAENKRDRRPRKAIGPVGYRVRDSNPCDHRERVAS